MQQLPPGSSWSAHLWSLLGRAVLSSFLYLAGLAAPYYMEKQPRSHTEEEHEVGRRVLVETEAYMDLEVSG